MKSADTQNRTVLQKLWAFGCSLKLAIALASAATLLIMGGSLVMHFNPRVFAGPVGPWFEPRWAHALNDDRC